MVLRKQSLRNALRNYSQGYSRHKVTLRPFLLRSVIGLCIYLASSILYTNTASASEGVVENILRVSEAVEIAVSDSPNLAEMQARYAALAEIPSQVGTLPDPTISFNAMNFPVDSFDRDQEAMTQLQVGFSQEFPFPGKLGLREEAAEFDAKAALHSVEEVRLQLINNVKRKWWQLYYLDRALETVDNNQMLLRQFITVAKTKYETGEGLQQDVLLAQLELSKLLDRKIQLVSKRTQNAARLNALLNLPTDQAIQLPLLANIDVALPPLKTVSTILQQTKDNRPALAEKRLLIDAATARQQLAKRNLLPDFTVGASYGFRQGNAPSGNSRSDLLSVKIAVNVPLFADRKQKMAIAQRHSEVKQQQYALQDRWLAIQAEITATIADYDRTREQVSLFETGVIPQARQTVASMLAGYQVNKVDFLNLIRAQITLYNYETNLWQTISEGRSALAKLVATVGQENIYE